MMTPRFLIWVTRMLEMTLVKQEEGGEGVVDLNLNSVAALTNTWGVSCEMFIQGSGDRGTSSPLSLTSRSCVWHLAIELLVFENLQIDDWSFFLLS